MLKEATGEDISTRAMMEYFKPLMSWLEEQNEGRQIGWDNSDGRVQNSEVGGKRPFALGPETALRREAGA